MLQGGVADKLGNEYELRWTLVETLRVLLGFAEELRLEPFNENADGLEFRLTSGSANEWHQCKRRRTSGSWTMKSLADEGVLQAFAGKLSAPPSECVFVSSDPAPAFESLLEKARLAETSGDFYGDGGIGKGDQKAIEELNSQWAADPDTIFDWLTRCRVEVVSDVSLRRRLEELCSVLFRTPPSVVVDRLKAFLIDNLGQRLTTERLRAAIGTLSIEWLAHLDDTLDAKFSAATGEYLASLSPPIAGLALPTSDFEGVLSSALDGDRPVTLVAGSAGSGKSLALARIIQEARARGLPVLAFRIDRYLEVRTLDDLGTELLGHVGSPVASFGSRFPTVPALLVIDQVDAVSEASGRSGRVRDLFFQLIEQTKNFPRMRVVAACRSYDLDRDTRLDGLTTAHTVTALRLAPLDWKIAVAPVLAKLGIEEASLSDTSRAVLSSPINLQLFFSIVEAGENADGELTSTRLFDKLIEVRDRGFRQAGLAWTASEAMGAVAQRMSDDQELTAPRGMLDRFPGAIDALSSGGLITAIGGKLQFVHESFFDHSFSRQFIATGRSVTTLLENTEQRLFRRTQVRQIFSRMRDAGGRTYAQNLKAVLLSPAVRYLVKDAVAYWLGEVVDPTPQELTIVEECLNAEATSNLAKVVINGRNWLPRLVESGAIDRLLSQGDSLRDLALWVLKKGCSSHSELVAGYMRQWWEAAPDEHQAELVAWFERLYPEGSIGQLLSLYADLIDAVPPSSINENFEANFELGSWVHKDRLLGAKVLGLWLTAWMRAFPTSQPFSDYRHNSHSYWVDELAKHEPIALLEATVPAFVEALKREKANLASGDLGYPSLRPPHSEHDQQYLRAILQAVETVSARDPAQAEKFIDKFSGDSDVELFVQLRAIAANGEVLGHRLVDLLGATRIFKVGDGHADWLPFAVAAAAALPHLELPERTQVEQAVLSYRPEYDWAREYRRRDKADELHFRPENPDKYVIDQLNINGQDERAILKTIGRDQLSAAARSRLDELDRKFPGARLPEAYGVRGGIVRSPIPPDKARFMSDAQWLNAMLRYADDSHHVYERDGVLGGARQLSSALQARVVEEPARFVALLDSLPVTVNAEYAEAVVAGLREAEVDGPLVARAIKAASRWPAAEFGRMAIWSVRKHPSSAQDAEVFAHVIQSAEHGSASDTAVTTMSSPGGKKEKETAREMLQGDGDLASSGLNSERGAAYEALATILWELEETLAPVVALLERAIETEPLVSVRFYMVHAINSVGKYDPDLAVDLLRRLVADDKRPLQGHHGHHIVGWVAHRSPGVIAEFSEELIKSSETELRALGHFFEALLALIYGDRNVEFVKSFQESALRRQVAGYRGGANVSSDHYGDRAAGWLMPLFSDENSLVRNDASGVEWGALLDGERDRSELVSAYIASPSFDENSDNLMRALEQRASKFPQLTFEAVNRILELASAWTDVARRGHFSTLHNLSRVLIELYRSADADSEGERKVLDLFDDYLARDLYDIRSEISAYERH